MSVVRPAPLLDCHPERSRSSAAWTSRAVERPLPSIRALWFGRNRILKLALEVLREIFDESAYARFLNRQGLKTSRQSYAAFRREHENKKACRPRCC